MAPISPSSIISPSSLKRSSPSYSNDEVVDGPTSKRRRVESILPQTPPPEKPFIHNTTRARLFDDDPRHLLSRSVALILQHVGFDGATKEALEALCAEVEAYAAHFLAQITASMLNARRPEPTPLDFEYALAQFDLPLASIRPHLKPPIPATKSRLHLESFPPEESRIERDNRLAKLLGDDLSGESDKAEKAYVPKKFIPFPSKHTYKWTEKESLRETDPRKIREEAAKSARHAEEALRRLVKISKAGQEKDIKLAASRDPRSKERHELWEKTMQDLMAGKEHRGSDDEDQSMIINSESQYFRKGIPRKSRALSITELRIDG